MIKRIDDYIMSYDASEGKDETCLVLARVKNNEVFVTAVYYGEEAEERYLTGRYACI